MLNIENSCCFTGYRPDKFDFPFDKSNPDYIQFTRRLVSAISTKILDGCTTFYTGMAHGFDIEAAEYVELIKRKNTTIKLIAVIPFNGQEKGWSRDWQIRYHELLANCNEVVVLNEKYDKWVYSQRNQYMVDRSRYVITYYDGKSGGTANTLHYAANNGREILNLFETDPLAKEKAQYKEIFCLIPPDN